MKTAVIRAIMRMLSWMTPQVAEYIAPPVAALLWSSSPRRRRVTRINLRAVYPDLSTTELQHIARSSMVHFIRGVFEAGMIWHWPLDRLSACVDEMQGREHIDAARQEGRAVIFAVPHYGAWEMLGRSMKEVRNGAILFKPGKDADIDELLLEQRRRSGATLVPATSRGIRTLFKILKLGENIALFPDQEPTLGEGQFAPFFGVETLTGVLLAKMAQRTGAEVLFVGCERRKGGRYRIHVLKADEGIYNEDMRVALTSLNRGIERCIAVDSEQYLWAYKRFRNRPDGEKSMYKR